MKLLSKDLLREYGFYDDVKKSDVIVEVLTRDGFDIIIKEGGLFFYSNLGIDHPLKDLTALRKLFKEVKRQELMSLKIMEKANCPVIAIPAGFSLNKAIKRITYATDYHNSDVVAINKAVDIAQASGAQLNILHICDAIIGADEEKTLMHDFMEKVKKTTSYSNLSFQIIHGYNVEARLEQYTEDESTDMLMMATHYRSFFDHVFGKSINRNVTRDASIPVVAFHYNAKTVVNLYS